LVTIWIVVLMFSRADRRVVENQTQRLFAELRRAAVALETARVSEITTEEFRGF
jgi:hypothetical protein